MAALLGTLPATPVAAQEAPAPNALAASALSIEAGLGATSLRDGTEPLLGAAVLIGESGALQLGLTGWLLPSPADMPGAAAESDLTLGFGYGGVVLRRWFRAGPELRAAAGLLVGAGNAKVNLKAIDTRIAADNFGVIEPRVTLRRGFTSMTAVQLAASYRHVFGVEDLPGIGRDQLAGMALRLSVVLGPF